jgi:hypothetical protein
MRRFTPVFFILLAVLLGVTSAVAQEEAAKPRAVPVEPVKDFDLVVKGEVIEHTFEIRNEGNAPLLINDVRPACGCTVAEYDRTVAPGKVGKVGVKVKTENFGGPIAKAVAVFTNDPENPKIQMVVKAKVKPFINVVPGYARYNYVQGEEVGIIPQTLWAEDGADVNILKVTSPHDYLEVTYREATEEERNPKGTGNQWRFEIKLAADTPVGPLRDYVEIEVDHPKQQVVKIPVSGFVRPRQHVTPQEIDFGKLEGSALPTQRSFHFTNFSANRIKLTEIETGHEAISAEVKPSGNQEGYRYRVVLTVGPEMPKGEFDGTVKIHTTDDKNPVVELPIKLQVL